MRFMDGCVFWLPFPGPPDLKQRVVDGWHPRDVKRRLTLLRKVGDGFCLLVQKRGIKINSGLRRLSPNCFSFGLTSNETA